MTPSLSGPASGSLPRLAISLMLAACSSTLCACRTISSPSGVTLTSLALRSKSLTSSSSSSFLMATDRVGCETKQASAALPKCFSRATATMYLSSVRVTLRLGLEVLGFSTQPAGRVPLGPFRMLVQHPRRERAGGLQQVRVQREIGEAQQWRAGLPRAQELTRPADLQVAASDLEPVPGLGHRLQPRARRLAEPALLAAGVQQHAGRSRGAAAHPAAQLVQLRQAEA